VRAVQNEKGVRLRLLYLLDGNQSNKQGVNNMARYTARLQTPQEIEAEMEQQKTKYKYTITEYSQDTRTWEISSDVKLTEEFITNNQSEFCDVGQSEQSLRIIRNLEDEEITIDKIEVAYSGTDYGDDTQVDIDGDFKE